MPNPASRLGLIPPYLFTEITRIKREAIAAGADIIDLGIGDPDLPTPSAIIEALAEAARNPETHRYDESPRGWQTFLDAACDWYRENFGVTLDPATDACQLIGSKEGLAHLAWAYAEAGDVVIVPDPGYPVYKVNALMAGAEVFETPLLEENGFLPDLSQIPADIAKRAKLLFVCYPHNPTGAVATREFYEEAIKFCRENDILLVNDMAYATVTYDGYQSPTPLQVEGGKDVTIEFHSLSKMFNMTGWRLGFAVGNNEAIGNLQRLKNNIDSKQFPAIAAAGAHALRNVKMEETMAIFQKRRDTFCDGLNSIGWAVEKPKASFYVWAKVPVAGMSSAEFSAALLQKAHIVCIPGNGYGPTGEGYVRFSLTLSGDKNGERFAEAIRRIADCGILNS